VIWDLDHQRYSRVAHGVDRPARKLELMPGLVGGVSTVYRHDRLFLGEGCSGLSSRVSLRLPTFGESPRDHIVSHHGALFELVPDGVCMVWTGHFEKFLE
jgi:hypothetical protein